MPMTPKCLQPRSLAASRGRRGHGNSIRRRAEKEGHSGSYCVGWRACCGWDGDHHFEFSSARQDNPDGLRLVVDLVFPAFTKRSIASVSAARPEFRIPTPPGQPRPAAPSRLKSRRFLVRSRGRPRTYRWCRIQADRVETSVPYQGRRTTRGSAFCAF